MPPPSGSSLMSTSAEPGAISLTCEVATSSSRHSAAAASCAARRPSKTAASLLLETSPVTGMSDIAIEPLLRARMVPEAMSHRREAFATTAVPAGATGTAGFPRSVAGVLERGRPGTRQRSAAPAQYLARLLRHRGRLQSLEMARQLEMAQVDAAEHAALPGHQRDAMRLHARALAECGEIVVARQAVPAGDRAPGHQRFGGRTAHVGIAVHARGHRPGQRAALAGLLVEVQQRIGEAFAADQQVALEHVALALVHVRPGLRMPAEVVVACTAGCRRTRCRPPPRPWRSRRTGRPACPRRGCWRTRPRRCPRRTRRRWSADARSPGCRAPPRARTG